MKIIVLIKQIRYIYAQTGTEIAEHYIGADDILTMINPLDELALEAALCVRDRQGDTRVSTLTLGDQSAGEGLRRTLALGADEALHLKNDDCENMDSYNRAEILSRTLQTLNFDLVLCGDTAMDHNSGLVGPFVAESLGIPHLTRVIAVELNNELKTVRVERVVERGDKEVLECHLPALLTIHKGMTLPRYPTLPGLLRAREEAIHTLKLKNSRVGGIAGLSRLNRTKIIGLSRPKPKKRKKTSNASKLSAADRLKSLMKKGPSEKKTEGNILEGSSEDMLSRMMDVLRDNGIIRDE